jgi:hypothetical protein
MPTHSPATSPDMSWPGWAHAAAGPASPEAEKARERVEQFTEA